MHESCNKIVKGGILFATSIHLNGRTMKLLSPIKTLKGIQENQPFISGTS